MKIVVRFFILCFSLIAPTYGAAIFSYVENITSEPFGNVYVYTADFVLEWDYSDTTANPCYLKGSCYLQPYLVKDGAWQNHVLAHPQSLHSKYRPCITTSPTLGALGQCLDGYSVPSATSNPGSVITFSSSTHLIYKFYSSVPPANYCFKIWVFGGDWGTQDLGTISGVCGIAPPPIGICSTPDSIDLDHGMVNSKFTSSTILSEQFNVECNQDMTATIILSGLNNGRLKLTDNLESELKINGYQADKTPNLNFKAGSNSINITSELINSGIVTGGEYQAQAIMTLAIE